MLASIGNVKREHSLVSVHRESYRGVGAKKKKKKNQTRVPEAVQSVFVLEKKNCLSSAVSESR